MRAEKQLLLDEIKDQIGAAEAFVIFSYLGLDAGAATSFRNEVAESGGNVEVMKKRLFKKAAEESGIALDAEMLQGHVGVAFCGEDSVAATKVVFKFSKSTDKAIKVIGGRIDGRLCDAAQMETLSKLPGKDEMRAQLLALFQAPMAQTLSVMQAVLTSVPYCLDNKVKQDGGES